MKAEGIMKDYSHIKTFRDAHMEAHRQAGWSEERIVAANLAADRLNPEAAELLELPIEAILKPGIRIEDLIAELKRASLLMQATFRPDSN